MEALKAASSAKLFSHNLRLKYKQTPTRDATAAATLSRPTEISFLGGYLKKKKHVNLCFPQSLHPKNFLPISSYCAFSASETQICAANEEFQTKDTTEFRTVHVKFQLQRECPFGQQFLMVGDDPMFGLWDPSSAIPLNWSEGHVWTVEMDIPCDKMLKYKFILKGSNDIILWQPDPDRILQTWETRKTITVCEDWDNADLQTIIEEDDPVTESVDNSEVPKVTESLLQPSGDSGSFTNDELTNTNGYSQPTKLPLAEKPVALVAENITEQNGIEDYQNSGRTSSSGNLIVSENEKNLDSSASIPVLVPGLPPIPIAETEEEASVSEVDKHIITDSSLESYKAQEFNVPELNLKEEPGIDLPISKEETQMLLNDRVEPHDIGHTKKSQLFEEKDQPNNNGGEDSVLKNDIQWGRRTLQQFLVNLGLL